ncbi:tetratricopeptide repeat protein [Gaopeijia maritima]|uniref:Tetratricopeptide repeat protein n=1 Tax=Gaopeijia maritima TaxID=3119007 RepID=A0ABU9EDS2_9BACT
MSVPGRFENPNAAARWVAALAVLVYLPSLLNGFAYDDLHIIVENDALHSLSSTLGSLLQPWWPGDEGATLGLWRPFTTLAFGVQWALGGGSPLPWHVANLLLHAAVSALVVRAGTVLMGLRAASLAGVVFAVHPLHVEAVANGVGQAELWAALWMLAAVTVLIETPTERVRVLPTVGSSSSARARPRAGRLGAGRTAAVVGLYALACLTKENAIVLPALLLVVEATRYRWTPADLREMLRRRGAVYGALALVGAGVLVARVAILGRVADPTPPLGAALLAEIPRIHTLGEIWYHYLRLLTVPLTLTPDYAPGVVPVTTVWTPVGAFAVAATLALAVLALWAWRRGSIGRMGALGLLWFAVAVLPVSNVVFVSGVLVAERTLYLPSVGAAWVLGGVASILLVRGRVARVAVALVTVLWIGRAVSYQPVWRQAEGLFEYMLTTVPQSARSQWILGDMLLDGERRPEAVRAYARALNHLGEETPFLTQTAGRLHQAGATRTARVFALRAWEGTPSVSSAQLLAVMAAGEADWTETVRWSQATRELDPLDPVAGHLLSVAWTELGQWADARAVREEMLARDPGAAWQPWYWLVELRARTGDLPGARAAVDSARARSSDAQVHAVIDSLFDAVAGGAKPLQNSSDLQIPRESGAGDGGGERR